MNFGIPKNCNDEVITNTNQNTSVWQDLLHPTCSLWHMLMCAVEIQIIQLAYGMDTTF